MQQQSSLTRRRLHPGHRQRPDRLPRPQSCSRLVPLDLRAPRLGRADPRRRSHLCHFRQPDAGRHPRCLAGAAFPHGADHSGRSKRFHLGAGFRFLCRGLLARAQVAKGEARSSPSISTEFASAYSSGQWSSGSSDLPRWAPSTASTSSTRTTSASRSSSSACGRHRLVSNRLHCTEMSSRPRVEAYNPNAKVLAP
jgi:hypothetical protein